MRFTESGDGVERACVRITLRVSRDEMEAIKAAAKKDDMPWRDWLASAADEGVRNALETEGGEYAQRYGKGDA